MRVADLFSKRQRTRDPKPLVRDDLPEPFRVQVARIMMRALGANDNASGGVDGVIDFWGALHDTVSEEHGLFRLTNNRSKRLACIEYLCAHKDVVKVLDVIELAFRLVERLVPKTPEHLMEYLEITQGADDAVRDLNARFGEHNLGYRYVDGEIVRVDSEYLHSEAAEPAIRLLHTSGFDGPLEEFRIAHVHFRHGRLKESTTEALKAFESTMKAICDARRWKYERNATAKDLIVIVLKEGLIPEYLQTEIAGLRNLLEASVPTVRNKTSGHGQGATPKPLPEHLAAYALHSAAANIVLLVQAHQALP